MPANTNLGSPLSILIGRELAQITFVRDYIQFGFDGPILNVIVVPILHFRNRSFRHGDPGYYDQMISLLNKSIIDATADDCADLKLLFADDVVFSISLRDEDLKFGPEAAVLYTDMLGGAFGVWPAGKAKE